MRRFLGIPIIVILFVMVGCGDGRVYREATSAIEEGRYELALELLDSIPQHNESDNLRNQAMVGIVVTAIEAEEFERALELLENIYGYDNLNDLRGQASTGLIQKAAEEYVLYRILNGGFHVPTSAVVLRAGYTSADGGCSYSIVFGSTGVFWLTIQANTVGGGARTNDSVILFGGERDREIMSNNDPGNDYDTMELLLDVARLNAVLREHWVNIGIIVE